MANGVDGVDFMVAASHVMSVFDADIGLVIPPPLLMVEKDVLDQIVIFKPVTHTNVQ